MNKKYGVLRVEALIIFLAALCIAILPGSGLFAQAKDSVVEESRNDVSYQGSEITELKIPIKFSGYFWVDTGYMERENTQSGQYNSNVNYMQGRFVLAGTYYREVGSFFALAKVELLGLSNEYAKSQYEPHTLDCYVKLGQKWWDVQIGRFLAWEVYYRGQGIELYTAEEAGALDGPSLYLLDYTRGHKNEAGQAALHVFPFSFLGLELATVYGQEAGQNNTGIRPVADFKLGMLRVIGGGEYLKQSPQTEADKVEIVSKGYAGRIQFNFPVVTIGAVYSSATVDYTNIQGNTDGEKSLDKTSMGGFADIDFWKNSIGLGYHYTVQKNKQGEENTQRQMFISYLYRLPVDGLSIKGVLGAAKAHIQDIDTGTEWDNDMLSFRVRVAYEFK